MDNRERIPYTGAIRLRIQNLVETGSSLLASRMPGYVACDALYLDGVRLGRIDFCEESWGAHVVEYRSGI